MRRPPPPRRRPPPRKPFPLARLLIAGVGFLVLGVGWKLTNAEPAGATAIEAAAEVAPTDYVPENSDPGPAPITIDPLAAADEPSQDANRPGAPLDFLRVTSSYGMRRHPILGFTPHAPGRRLRRPRRRAGAGGRRRRRHRGRAGRRLRQLHPHPPRRRLGDRLRAPLRLRARHRGRRASAARRGDRLRRPHRASPPARTCTSKSASAASSSTRCRPRSAAPPPPTPTPAPTPGCAARLARTARLRARTHPQRCHPGDPRSGVVRDLLPRSALTRSRLCAAARLVRDDIERMRKG